MDDSDVVVIDARRTAIGSFCGSLSNIPATHLGATLIKSMLDETGINPVNIDEVIIGQVLTAGCGQNPARQTAFQAGIPVAIPALTINKVCGSGLKSIQIASQAIRSGDAGLIIAGGQENMSQSPHILMNSRKGTKMGASELKDSMVTDGLWDAFNDYHMGQTAENVAKKWEVTREEQDLFALNSQKKATDAKKSHAFAGEIVPMTIPVKGKEPLIFSTDEFHRPNTTLEGLAKLRPAFMTKDGTVTAGNSSGVNDGAAMIILASRKRARELGLKPIAVIRSIASAGVDPALMGTGPIPASLSALDKAGWSIDDLDLIEANEAFAAQAIVVNRKMGWDTDKVNVNGGAIALGHPIGASGARIFVSLIHELKRKKMTKGLATLCIGGGMGIAVTVEMI